MSLLSRLAVQAARAYGILSSNPNNVSADYLVVAGGGGGGASSSTGGSTGGAGGGGAGGFLASTATLSTLNTYSITVGAGGNGSTSQSATGSSGSNSVLSGTGLSTITSTGGGGGGSVTTSSARNGLTGGSGGGGGATAGLNGTGGSGTSGQGSAGGSGITDGATYDNGGGGGGASAVGSNATSAAGGNGGAGTASSISGSSVTYAGGGGGSAYPAKTQGTGGAGGGGNSGSAGTANLGGGGGGGIGSGNAGGSGIVIISYTSATPKFVGGTITTSGGKQIHTFTSSGTLSPITPITASYLVVAGGGSGGARHGGGGGAGGLLTNSTTLYSGATYVVTVGAGGAALGTGSGNAAGNSGSNSSLLGTGITTITSTGGGGGGSYGINGVTGGSGGGGGEGTTPQAAGSGTTGQGNAGGAGSVNVYNGGGGGGGAGAAGAAGNSGSPLGKGGDGVASSITGSSVTYAGGGGGSSYLNTSYTGSNGGSGGGGAGQYRTTGVSGTTNTGGGGGGGSTDGVGTNYASGSGGSGIVIISYAGSQQFNGGLVTTSGGNTIHTFTSTGALTPLTNNLNNSLRFRQSASAYLSRTASVAPTSNQKGTFSFWMKRGLLGYATEQWLFAAGSNSLGCYIPSSDRLSFEYFGGSYLVTTQVFRDPSAWYHIVVAIDTTQATASNRVKLYVNGNQVTAFSTEQYPSQNATFNWMASGQVCYINQIYSTGRYFDGYIADFNFIDGQALEPYYFGNNDANGVWKPIQYKGTYGTNGFYLTFGNTTSTTTLGYDSSPNGNNWTCNNISLTAGTTYDAMTDVPTNTSATVANYCVLNPLQKGSGVTLSNANLTWSTSGSSSKVLSTIGMSSGKYYCEFTMASSNGNYGVATAQTGISGANYLGDDTNSWCYAIDGKKYTNGSGTTYGATYTAGDIIGVAFDADAGTLTYYKNGTSQGTAFTGLTSGPYFFAQGADPSAGSVNFGQRPFSYTPPTGFVALNTFNLPTPTILQGNKYFDSTLYSGNNVGQVVVNQGQFRPDFLWIKVRTNTYDHTLADSVRGVSAFLASNTTAAESTNSELTSFNSNGFTLGATGSMARNVSGQNYVGWQWQSGQGSTSTNTSGSITSTVSVNTTAGFSIISWTSTGSNGTIGHGLGVAPVFIIARRRNTAENWIVYHKNMGGNNGYLLLNGTGAFATGVAPWNSTDPTSSVISINNSAMGAGTSNPMITYAWAEIAGFSRFASYTGNGSTNGPFIYLGFRPKYLLIKCTSTAEQWAIKDTSLVPYNTNNTQFFANAADAETTDNTYHMTDFLSNGFKIRGAAQNLVNGNGQTYIYAAFAENPFKNANAR